MDRKKCAACRDPDCRRLRAMAISMLESDPEYPWRDFKPSGQDTTAAAATLAKA